MFIIYLSVPSTTVIGISKRLWLVCLRDARCSLVGHFPFAGTGKHTQPYTNTHTHTLKHDTTKHATSHTGYGGGDDGTLLCSAMLCGDDAGGRDVVGSFVGGRLRWVYGQKELDDAQVVRGGGGEGSCCFLVLVLSRLKFKVQDESVRFARRSTSNRLIIVGQIVRRNVVCSRGILCFYDFQTGHTALTFIFDVTLARVDNAKNT